MFVNPVLQDAVFSDDDLLELILAYLPIESDVRARSVCKNWRQITSSKRFLQKLTQKPWYFIISGRELSRDRSRIGHAYDAATDKWRCIELPYPVNLSGGLVCFVMLKHIYVCNPMTRQQRKLPKLPGFHNHHGNIMLALSAGQKLQDYSVLFLKWEQCELSFEVYNSATKEWTPSRTDVVSTEKVDHCKCIICNGILYVLIKCATSGRSLLAYEFSNILSSSPGTLVKSFIQFPFQESDALVNVRGQLVVVGRRSFEESGENSHRFGVWLLEGKDWQFICLMPGEYDIKRYKLFGCSDLIFFRALQEGVEFEDRKLLVFDMNLKQWRWSHKCPISESDSFGRGFGFEPRLDISP